MPASLGHPPFSITANSPTLDYHFAGFIAPMTTKKFSKTQDNTNGLGIFMVSGRPPVKFSAVIKRD
jgi:hypothetical protein